MNPTPSPTINVVMFVAYDLFGAKFIAALNTKTQQLNAVTKEPNFVAYLETLIDNKLLTKAQIERIDQSVGHFCIAE